MIGLGFVVKVVAALCRDQECRDAGMGCGEICSVLIAEKGLLVTGTLRAMKPLRVVTCRFALGVCAYRYTPVVLMDFTDVSLQRKK